MTVAVCLKCGAMKHGAFNPCPACRFVPKENDDVARHLLATDHYFKKADLEAMGAHVKEGKPINFHPDQVEQVKATLGFVAGERVPMRVIIILCLAVLGLLATAALFGYAFYRNLFTDRPL